MASELDQAIDCILLSMNWTLGVVQADTWAGRKKKASSLALELALPYEMLFAAFQRQIVT